MKTFTMKDVDEEILATKESANSVTEPRTPPNILREMMDRDKQKKEGASNGNATAR